MNTLFSRLRKSVALFSVAALLSTLVVVAPASAAWYDAAVAALGDPSYQTMSASEKEAALSRNMSRQDAAVVLHRALGSPMAATMTMETLPFTDKAEIAAYAVNAVLFHTEEGLLQGNPDGTLRPEAGLNRAELVVILDRAGVLGEEMATMTAAQEAEFVGAEWARAAFARAVASGVVQGYPDGTLRPAGPVNAAETFVLAYRALVSPTEPTTPGEEVEEGEEYDFTSPLRGDAGTVVVQRRSAGVENEVQEGAKDTIVLGFEVEAKDSDVRLQNVRLEFVHTGDGSTRLERYATDVSVWQEGREVGRDNVSSFTRTRVSGDDIYSRQMPLSNAVVRQNDRVRFFVAVSALTNLDSGDLNEEWEVSATTVRFEDATGVVTTTSDFVNDVENEFVFEDTILSGQAELRFSKGANNPEATAIEVNRNTPSSDILVLEFNIRTQGATILVDELTFDVNVTGADADDVVDRLTLRNGSQTLGVEDGDDQVVFDDLEDFLTLQPNTTTTLQVFARFKQQNGNYSQGTTVQVELDRDATVAENEKGDRLVALDNYRGSARGEEHTLFVDGIVAQFVSANASKTTNDSSSDEGEFVIVFDVTAFGDDAYINPANALAMFDLAKVSAGGAEATPTAALSSTARFGSGGFSTWYEVTEGRTERFTLTVSVVPEFDADPADNEGGFYEVRLTAIPFTSNGNALSYTSELTQFRTSSINLIAK